MPAGLNKATNYYNRIEAWRDWADLAAQALKLGLAEDVINLSPKSTDGWRKIDKQSAKLKVLIADKMVEVSK